ncbi:MAG: NAD(+)/NADH kinase [Bacteroidetes bacterium]|nr:NAD(+)/NADH kinase [Bacteroidota bacterium]
MKKKINLSRSVSIKDPLKTKITIGILGNTSKPEVADLLKHITDCLKKNNLNYLIERSLSDFSKNRDRSRVCPEKDITGKSDYIFSLGGDGTFLNSAKIVKDKNIPILGINLGRLGFFSEISPSEFSSFIPKFVKGKFRITEQVVIRSDTKGKKTLFGLNDIVIDKNDSIRTLETEAYYNNEKVVTIISDGIIISTPTGSTGYSMSCNGPIVNPDSKVFLITPISPHTLNVRPIVVPDNGNITIKIKKRGRVRISADGQSTFRIDTPVEVLLTKADYTVKVIKKNSSTYFDTIRKKLFWNADKRYN